MTRTLGTFLKQLSGASLLAATLFSSRGEAQVVIYPPAAWIATATPTYYEGRPAYWYGNRWYYRNGGSWGYYHDEPEFLRGHRGGGRVFYEGHRGERGGWHGGGHRR